MAQAPTIMAILLSTITFSYFAFGEDILSSYCMLWIDVLLAGLGWFNIPELVPLQAHHVKCTDSRIVKCYTQDVGLTKPHPALRRAYSAVKTCQLTCKQQWEDEALNTLTIKAKLYAKSQCHKHPVGQVHPWCPRVTKAFACILYLKGIKRELREHT